jgi:hypothetical protein
MAEHESRARRRTVTRLSAVSAGHRLALKRRGPGVVLGEAFAGLENVVMRIQLEGYF